jgi:hypothetical protein
LGDRHLEARGTGPGRARLSRFEDSLAGCDEATMDQFYAGNFARVFAN